MEAILFNPISIVFYMFGIILPTILILYTISHIVYILGEIRVVKAQVPIIILLLILKLLSIGFALTFIYQTLFDYRIEEISHTSITIVIWGLLILCDTNIINNSLNMVCKYKGEEEFNKYIQKGCFKLFTKNKTVYFLKSLLIILLTICSISTLFVSTHPSMYIMIGIFMVYLLINYNTWKYVRNIKE